MSQPGPYSTDPSPWTDHLVAGVSDRTHVVRRRLLVGLIVVVVLLVGADLGAKALAQRRFADRLGGHVDVAATSFFSQVVAGRYGTAHVGQHITVGKLGRCDLQATLHDVHGSRWSLLTGGDGLVAGSVEVTLTISAEQLRTAGVHIRPGQPRIIFRGPDGKDPAIIVSDSEFRPAVSLRQMPWDVRAYDLVVKEDGFRVLFRGEDVVL